MNNNIKKIVCSLILLLGVLTLVGCGNKENNKKVSKINNPGEITIKGEKGTTKFNYENDDTFEETATSNSVVLKNSKGNFNIFFEYSRKKIEDAEKQREKYKDNSEYELVEDISYNGYKSYAIINKSNATVHVFSYLDENDDVVIITKISAITNSKVSDEIKNGTDSKNILFYQDKVQQVLKSMKYTKNK